MDAASAGVPEAELIGEVVGQADLLAPMVLRTAATLRLVDLVESGADTALDLAGRLDADVYRVDVLVANLVDLGVLVRSGDRLAVTGKGALLGSEHPARLRSLLDSDGCAGRADLAATWLKDSVLRGVPAYELAYGRGYWADVDARPELAEHLQSLRVRSGVFDEDLIVESPDWAAADSVVDVGGGDGGLLSRLLRRHPHLSGSVVDLPPFAEHAARLFEEHGLGDRARAIGGSFFDPLPAGADVYLLSSILYDWDDDAAVRLLRNCASAAGSSGSILVCEITLDGWGEFPDNGTKLRMAAMVPGRERSLARLSELANAAGLTLSGQRGPTRYRSYQRFQVS
ncbi:hypothetical protein GCM10027271_26930 [Saccharopolyspora gloriosae]|uniref:O-methyltransferase C-terminal domain-containing protein n=1 Tax=Saccharopolyspora gloriosae TaxID=455344 RepID=A0A840NMB7_9PSEU|nr:hypothetical protein [Saccharopolyspora gloriosae]